MFNNQWLIIKHLLRESHAKKSKGAKTLTSYLNLSFPFGDTFFAPLGENKKQYLRSI